MFVNEGYRQVQIAEILGKQSEVQRCKEADDRVVQLLCVGEMEYAS